MKKFFLIASILIFSLFGKSKAQTYEATDLYEAQAVYLYSICKYMQWPTEALHGNFIIGVLSNDPIISELKKIASTRKYVSQPIEIKVFNSISELTKTHVLFVPNRKTEQIDLIVNKINKNQTLLVSNKKGAISLGAGINFILSTDGKLKFEINKGNILNKGIKVNSTIDKLAIKIYS